MEVEELSPLILHSLGSRTIRYQAAEHAGCAATRCRPVATPALLPSRPLGPCVQPPPLVVEDQGPGSCSCPPTAGCFGQVPRRTGRAQDTHLISQGALEATLPEGLLTRQPGKELREQEKLHGDPVGAHGLAWQVEGSLKRLTKEVSHWLETGNLQNWEPCEERLDPDARQLAGLEAVARSCWGLVLAAGGRCYGPRRPFLAVSKDFFSSFDECLGQVT